MKPALQSFGVIAEFLEQSFATIFRSEEADIPDLTLGQLHEVFPIARQVVAHHDGRSKTIKINCARKLATGTQMTCSASIKLPDSM